MKKIAGTLVYINTRLNDPALLDLGRRSSLFGRIARGYIFFKTKYLDGMVLLAELSLVRLTCLFLAFESSNTSPRIMQQTLKYFEPWKHLFAGTERLSNFSYQDDLCFQTRLEQSQVQTMNSRKKEGIKKKNEKKKKRQNASARSLIDL